jgi:thiamine biosynthesis protein ThiS
MSTAESLSVNGLAHRFDDGTFPATVAALIVHLGLDARMVVAEVNGDIVGRDDFSSRALKPGDTVELVRLVGGG